MRHRVKQKTSQQVQRKLETQAKVSNSPSLVSQNKSTNSLDKKPFRDYNINLTMRD
jgi:hypothetical protein